MTRDEEFQRNLPLALEFIGQLIDDPSRLNTIPDGSVVVFDALGQPQIQTYESCYP